jgi:CHAT domain-containing protein/Tfp pilus assembly protein PilF
MASAVRATLAVAALLALGLAGAPARPDRSAGPGQAGEEPAQRQLKELREQQRKSKQFYQQGKYAEATESARRALALCERLYPKERYPDGHPDVALSLNNLGVLLNKQGRLEESLTCLQRALAMRERLYPKERYPDGHPQLAHCLNNLGLLLQDRGQLDEARPHLERALAMYERLYPKGRYPDGHPQLATSLNNLGFLLRARGSLEEALPYYEHALAIRERLYPKERYPQGHPDLALSLNNLGALLRARGRLDEARPYSERALALCERLYPKERFPDGHPQLANSLGNLGFLLQERGRLDEALPYAERALAMYERLYPKERYPEGHPELAMSLNTLGMLLQARGRPDEARPCYERALAMRERLYPKGRYPQGHPDLAVSLSNLGALLQARGRPGEALPYAERALAMRERLYPKGRYPDGHPDLAASLTNLGVLLQERGRLGEARPYCERALALCERLYPKGRYPQGHPLLGNCLNNLGGLLWARGRLDEALPYSERALAMRERLYPDGHPLLANSLNNLGALLQERGQLHEALRYYERALAVQQSLLEHFAQGSAEAEALDLARSLPLFRDALLSATADVPGGAGRAYRLVWPTRSALARALERRRRALRGASPQAGRTAADLLATRRQIEATLAAPAHDVAARDAELRRLTRRKEELERALAAALPALAGLRAQDRLGPGDLAASLPVQSAFVDLLRYARLEFDPKKPGRAGERYTPSYAAFVVAPGGEVSRVELGPAAPLEAALARWRQDLARGAEGRAAQELRRLLWRPLAARLPAGTESLYLAADGALARLPWAALPLDGAGTPLLERYTAALVPSGSFLLQRLRQSDRPPDRVGAVLAVGGVHYDRAGPGKSYLPGTARELERVRALAGTRPCVALSGAAASPDRLLAELPRARFVHLATHGFFKEQDFLAEELRQESLWRDWHFQAGTVTERVGVGKGDPLAFAGLALAGANQPRGTDSGLVSGETLAALDLDDLELAVLSACETGLDLGASPLTGEGGQTLARALHVAGARNVVASLWKVPDVPTLVLMEQFYRRLWDARAPQGPAEALRQAQLALWRDPGLVQKRLREVRAELVQRGLGEAELEARGFGRELKLLPGGGRVEGLRRSPALWWAGFALSGDGR